MDITVETNIENVEVVESKESDHIDSGDNDDIKERITSDNISTIGDEEQSHHENIDDENEQDEDENDLKKGNIILTDDNDDDDDGIEAENTDDTEHLIPIVSSSGAITYQSANTGQQYSLNLPNANIANVKIVKVVPLPHARSEVWSYFGFIADDDGEIQDKKKAICKICASTLAYSGNTTNLFTHLKAMHPEANPQKLAPTNRTPRTGKKSGKRKYFEIATPGEVIQQTNGGKTIQISSPNTQQYIIRAITYSGNSNESNDLFESSPTIQNENKINVKTVLNNQSSSPTILTTGNIIDGQGSQSPHMEAASNNSIDDNDTSTSIVSCDDITDSIVNMLVKDCRPINVVEGKGFEDLMKLLAPAYKIPDSERLKILVKKKYEEVRRNLILRAMDEDPLS